MAWLGCAKEMPPPGTRPDLVAPSVERISPAPDSVLVGFDGQVELRFDEPVQIPGDIARRMFASPMEEYVVEQGFSNMRFRPRDGWRDNVVYCYEIPGEGIVDLLRNRMATETEFCISTGPDIADTRVQGSVIDAVTGLPQNEARVIFWAGEDSIPYGAITDDEGRFSARSLPPGEYQAFGFVDQNRNLIPDRDAEPHDSAMVVASIDAVPELSFAVVPPDTTPPLVLRAEATDSLTVQIEFDDHLLNPQPGEPSVVIRDSASRAPVEIVAIRMGTPSEAAFPEPDSAGLEAGAAPDSAGLEAALDSAAVAEGAPTLPTRFVSVRLGAALDSATYSVEVEGAVNLRHLVGGGDTTFVFEPPPPDTAGVRDTLGLPPDTLAAPPDTVGAPPAKAARARVPRGLRAQGTEE